MTGDLQQNNSPLDDIGDEDLQLLLLQQQLQDIQALFDALKQQQEDLDQQKQELLQRWGSTSLQEEDNG